MAGDVREVVAACVLLLGSTVLVPGAFAEPTVDAQRYVDLLFTDVSQIEDVVPWGEGYVAATRGGLVISPADGVREVLSAQDGLPSNVVWSIERLESGFLVGTEGGAAIVDASDLSVQEVDAPADFNNSVGRFVQTVEVTEDGEWWIQERGGNISKRASDGSWTSYPRVPEHRTNDLEVENGRTVVAAETDPVGGGDSFWGIYELANGSWEKIHETERPPVKVEFHGDTLFVGTREDGLKAFENGSSVDPQPPSSLDDKTVLALESDGDRFWVGTKDGLFLHETSSASWTSYNETRLPETQIETIAPLDNDASSPLAGILLGTSNGLLVPEGDPPRSWRIHSTVNGPSTNQFLSLESRNGTDVWAGTSDGADIFFPSVRLWNHWDQSEISSGLRAEQIYDIEHRENLTWFATNYGVYQLNWTSGNWRILIDQDPDLPPGNRFFDVEPDGDELWMPEWGAGLLHHYIDTNTTYDYQIEDGLISHGLTCVDRWHEFLAVCQSEAFQLFNLSRASNKHPIGLPYSECNNYACNYSAPMNFTLDALPDGERIWVGSAHAGLVSLVRDPDEGIAVEKQWTVEDGLPSDEVRAIEKASDGVWVGTTGGLAHVSVSDGVTQTWEEAEGFGQPAVNAIEPLGGTLYVATYSGMYRLDLDSRELLPLYEGAESLSKLPGQVSVTFPERGARLAGDVDMTGKAQLPGGTIDRVEVRLDNGSWSIAQGRSDWTYHLPVEEMEPGDHEAQIRVMSNGTDIANVTHPFEVVDASTVDREIYFDHVPPRRVGPGERILLQAEVAAPHPMDVSMEAEVAGETLNPRGQMSGSTASFVLAVPEEATDEIRYTFTVRSGAGTHEFPREGAYRVPIEETKGRSFTMELEDPSLQLAPGESAIVNVTLQNTGGGVEEFETSVTGMRSNWVTLDAPDTLTVPPDRQRSAPLEVTVPEQIHPLTTVLGVEAASTDQVLAQTETLTIEVQPAGEGSTFSGGQADAPGPAVGWLALALVGAALALRRSREGDR